MTYFAAMAIAVALIVVAIFGCALGQGRVVSSAVEGMARQPCCSRKDTACYDYRAWRLSSH